MQGFIHFRFTTAVVLFALVSQLVLAQQPFVSITSNDGTQYLLYKNGDSVTASVASAKCAAAGGTLASITSAEQVRDTLWSKPVVDAVGDNTSLLWTGIKITWPSTGSHRRMLRGSRTHHVADATRNGNEFPNDELETNVMDDEVDDVGMSLIELLAKQMDGSTDFLVPTHTGDGRRRLPELLRLWLYEQHLQTQQIHTQTTQDPAAARLRNLLSRDGGSPYLHDAKLTWADGSDASFVLANPSNMGFLACNNKKLSECCGAVFDIGPGPYMGSEFPTIFFYPCGAEKVSGAMLPTGYLCAVTPQVAQLPKPSKPSPSKAGPSPSSGSSPRKCTPGTMPAAKVGTLHPCTKCKPNTYSDDGTKCKKCPAGKTSERGATVCS